MVQASSRIVPPIRLGMRVRVRPVFPFALPRGLRAGAEAEVLRMEGGSCLVRDDDGREWLVGLVSLDPGELMWASGHWVPAA